MTLFELMQLIVFGLITVILTTGILLILMFAETLIKTIIKARREYNKQYPVGFTRKSETKKPFFYGKWKLLGKDQNGYYLFERLK